MKIKFLENEYWYGGIVHIGYKFPVSEKDELKLELVGGNGACDQYSPLFLSSKGRIIHGERAFNINFSHGEIEIDDRFNTEILDGFENLKGAQHEAAKRWYTLEGKVPNLKFFEAPQYNTWIELMYNQNEKQILQYAQTLVDGKMKPGVLMIDEGWAPNYGVYDFDPIKFPNPKGLVEKLHSMGFSVMLWITPMISPDSHCFRELRDHTPDILVHDENGEFAVRKWWNGYSCVLDFTNPKTQKWFAEKLNYLTDEYGVDGFKFDSGDTYLYQDSDRTFVRQEANAHTAAFNRFCENYEFNELRNVWNCGGARLICRLQDKSPNWTTNGIKALVPNILTQGILGYFFGCPDMIGGGSYGGFLGDYKQDEELYLRWLAASVLCPMMQFSISPKRILSEKSFEAVQKLASVREKYTEKIISLAKNASVTGEPIVRYMEYEFPNSDFENVTDQFMLGSDTLVAPIFEQGKSERDVILPIGNWKTALGQTFIGGNTVKIHAELDDLIILEKM